jgi:V/A-type H+-transporting ATPase subunit E
MSIDNILSKIAADAALYESTLVAEATAEAKIILAAAEEKAETIREKADEQSAKESLIVLEKRQASAEAEARKMRLVAKQEMIDKAFEAAIDRLSGMKSDEYISFLAEIIVGSEATEGELLLNARDKKAIGSKLVKTVNKALGGGKISLSGDLIDAKGGFVLKYGGTEINATLDTIVRSVKDAATPELLEVLFKK